MTSLSKFRDSLRFPAFADCPLLDSPTTDTEVAPYYLLGTIAEDMTVSAAPTFILKDRNRVAFALTLRVPAGEIKEGIPGGGFDARGFKKGFTAVVESARRSGVREGKAAGFVVAPSGRVKIIPASLQKLNEMSDLRDKDQKGTLKSCQACSAQKPKNELLICTGCRCVWYCNKECQTMGWKENEHKRDCKILKACREVFPRGIGLMAEDSL